MIGGIGQPIDYAAMAKGQGLWSPDQLAQGLQLARGQGATLGNPEGVQQAQQAQQQNLAEMMARYKEAQSNGDLGDQLLGTQYVQNSGALGALAQALSMGIGGRIKKLATDSATDYASRIFEEEQRQAAAQAEAQAKAEADRQAALWARDDAVRADTQNFQLTLEERKAADRAEREARAEQARERRHRERLGAQGGGSGMLVTGPDAERIGLDPAGRYWIDGRTGKPSVIQAPATAADQRQTAERDQATATAAAELAQIENVLTRLEGNISESGFGIPWAPGRRQFDADAKALAVYLKPLIRKPGENWTDNDQTNLERLTANLYDPESVNANRFADIRSLIAGRRQALGIEAAPAAGGDADPLGLRR